MTYDTSTLFWIFVAFYLLHEAVVLTLDLLNYRHTQRQTEPPSFYHATMSRDIFARAKAYALDKLRFGLFSHIMQVPFFWILILLDGFNILDLYAVRIAGAGTLAQSVAFILLLGLYFSLVSLPFKLYSTFVIEERHGFNKTTTVTFLGDLAKGVLLSLALGVPLLYMIFGFMRAAGEFWWIFVWAGVTAFQLVVAAVFPAFLAPLFNKFTPLAEGPLKERIVELARRIGFRMSGIFTIDGSRRSGHSNAYFAGMGRFRRIVLYDTLMRQLSEDEVVAVLAHEMGHNVKKHILKTMLLSTTLSLAGFFVLSRLIDWPEFYRAFNVANPSHHAAFAIFALISESFTFLLTPLMNLWSRKNEYEADRFAVTTTGHPGPMKSALLKLATENLSNPTPHPAYSFYHYSHPTTAERAGAIDRQGSSAS